MCRLLLLHDPDGVDPAAHLDHFRELSRHSREYQGHGWGCAWLDDHRGWCLYHNIQPVWEDSAPPFPRTRLFIAHARSAFRDEGIAVENNMPFGDGRNVFAFNGELRGVRIREQGRIGAEKVFNYIKRFDRGDPGAAVERGIDIIQKRTRYVRAMNFFLANRQSVYVASVFNEDPEYFQLRQTAADGLRIICSEPYRPEEYVWEPIPTQTVQRLDV